jgi:enoyl-CoA hydratase
MSIDLEREGAIAIVTVNRPDRLNALSSADLEELQATLRTIGGDRAVRAMIFTGAGDRAFIAGADIREMSAFSEDEAMAFGRLGHAVASAIEHLPQPVVVAVNGYAFGGGCELALAADIRIASTNAEFSQPEVKLGIPPGWGGTQRLPRAVGPGHAAEMILTGKRVNAEEALRIGLVNSIHEPDELLDAARSIAAQIAANSPNAVRLAKSLMSAEQRQDPVVGLDAEAHAFAGAFDHPDQTTGMAAFLEKRTATFEDQAT